MRLRTAPVDDVAAGSASSNRVSKARDSANSDRAALDSATRRFACEAGSTGHPNRKGFDFFFGYLNQVHAHNYFPDYLWKNTDKVSIPKDDASLRADWRELASALL